ncbi:DUF4064 domain-containing protein [Lentibacillus sediminis]|uniref:DUF4064 domain-containing protein n=1 Tax=Lentibacillus sediminis TaxID=1940529 RepID=UPI000C1BC16F|nr:DUF4064 domain-containing protein [Lentibacillus sediminis]
MIKRTGEIVLVIIGMLIYAFFALIGGALIWLGNNSQIVEDLPPDAQSPELSQEQLMTMIETAGAGGMMILISALVAIVAGILALVFMKGNKKPKAAGIILIVVSIIGVFTMVIAGMFSGLFYLIAGIMLLVRKPKTPLTE